MWDLKGIVTTPSVLFLEEAQHLKEAGLFIKGLVDRRPGFPVIATGSASYHLIARTRESLAGRARRARVFPFSLDEVSAPSHRSLAPALARAQRLDCFERHVRIGGYPAVWQSVEPRLELAELVDAFVIRDASDLFEIQRPEAFRLLLQLAARQVGSAVRLSEWSSLVGVSVPTVSKYLSHMEESHILVQLPLFAGGKRAELTQAPKVYFVDVGLRNWLVGDLGALDSRGDRGPALEAWVFSELHKTLPFGTWLGWWRTRGGAEVDFVARNGDLLVGVEVKASQLREPKITRSARSFIDAYSPRRFLVANLGLEHVENLDDTVVEWCHPIDIARRVTSELFPQQS